MTQSTCTHTYPNAKHNVCEREHYKNGKCILHLEKQVATDWLDEEIKQINNDFIETLAKEIEFAKLAPPDYELNWSGIHFPPIKFDEKWIFPRRVLLTAARFEHGISFKKCRFYGELKANKAIFFGVGKNFNFENCYFDDEADFSSAELGKNPILNGCVFNKKSTFDSCKLDTPDFLSNKFLDGVSFMGVTFSSQGDFKTCEFHGEINFDSMMNEGVSFDFREAKFFGKLKFGYAPALLPPHCNDLDFSDAEVQEKASLMFGNIKLDTANFERLTLLDGASLQFHNMIFGKCNFKSVEQRDKTAVNFSKTDLSNTTFLNTNIEKFILTDVIWCPINLRLGARGNREGLVSECDLINKISTFIRDPKFDKNALDSLLKEVDLNSENYRQLVKNSDARRNYTLAETFHIGEMEMQRQKAIINGAKHSKFIRKLMSWNGFSIYKVISKYGTSYLHSLVILIGMIFFSAMLSLLSGLTETECNKSPLTKKCEYNNIQMTLILNPDKPFIGFENIGAALLYTLGVATLQKDTLYKPATALGEFLRLATILFVTGQGALTLFAVRRKFRRGGGE